MAAETPKRIGIIGGGQLAWMMAKAAPSLGVQLVIQTPQMTDPAIALTRHSPYVDRDPVIAAVSDASATAQLAQRCHLITFENEFVDLAALAQLEQAGVCFRPPLAALAPLLDKYEQRLFLQRTGLPVPPFFALESFHWTVIQQSRSTADLCQRTAEDATFPFALTLPLVLKTRRHGYDGQGTFIVRDLATLQHLGQRLQAVPLLLEAFVPFDRELAIIAARGVNGEQQIYPVVETQQENQVCQRVIAPAGLTPQAQRQCEAIAYTLLTELKYVGIMGIELFLTTEGHILVNEIAPRTHNSGHFSLNACITSQFEQHLRAVSGLSLGAVNLTCDAAVMINLLGYEHTHSHYHAQRQAIAALPGTHVWWYGKAESRPGRKLGHVTVVIPTVPPELMRQTALEIAHQVEQLWRSGNSPTSLTMLPAATP